MAKFRVVHSYHDKELKQDLRSGETVEMTVKRADYVNSNNKNKVKMLERVQEETENEDE